MNKDASANVFALLEGADNEIRRLFDRRELRGYIGGDAAVVGHDLMDSEIVANRLEHFTVEVGDTVFASQSYPRTQLANYVVIVILGEAVKVGIAESLGVFPECLTLLDSAAQLRRWLRDALLDRPGRGFQMADLAIAEVVDDEKLHRRHFALFERLELKVGLVHQRMKVDIDLTKDVIFILYNDLRPQDFADAIVGPV